MFQTFFINLDRMPLRRAQFVARASQLGLSHERITAVDGSKIGDGAAQGYTQEPDFRDLEAGEIGCFLSHRKIWETIVSRQLPHAFVCEDDLFMADDLPAVLDSLSQRKFAELVRLEPSKIPGLFGAPSSLTEHRKLRKCMSLQFGTGAYYIRLSAARSLLERASAFSRPVDHFMYDPARSGMQIYQVWPCPTVQDILIEAPTDLMELSELRVDKRGSRIQQTGQVQQSKPKSPKRPLSRVLTLAYWQEKGRKIYIRRIRSLRYLHLTLLNRFTPMQFSKAPYDIGDGEKFAK